MRRYTAEQMADHLLRSAGSVGATQVRPRFVGATQVRPRFIGAPANMVPDDNEMPIDYSQQAYKAGDVSYMGLGETIIAPLTQITLPAFRPNRPITPQKIGFKSTVIGLLINQISIGGVGLFASENGVPVELLSEVSTFPQLLWPTVDPSTGIVFQVTNPTAGALPLSGAIYGAQVRI